MYLLCTADPIFLDRKLPFREANLREFWFASTLGANSETLKEAAKCSTFTLAIWLSAHIPVKIQLPAAREAVTRQSFSFQLDKTKLQAAQQRDGHYLLRSNLTSEDPAVLWTRYVQLTQIESVFRSLKSELGLRPIYHQLQHRAEAHVLIAFLAYCLQVTLKNRLMIHAPGLTASAVLEKLATIQMVEVWIPTVDGRWLVLPRHTQPEKDVQALLDQIHITLPPQPPPRIKAPSQLPLRTADDTGQPVLW